MEQINNEYYTKEVEDISMFLSESEKKLTSVTEKRRISDFKSSKVITDELSKEFESLQATTDDSKTIGTPTGFPRLNVLTHGFQKGQLIILAARPGVGKTALSLNKGQVLRIFSCVFVPHMSQWRKPGAEGAG